jgi:hypothetical protein
MRRAWVVLAALLVGCAPLASTPSPSPAVVAATAAPTRAGAPYAGEGSDTPICLPGQVPVTIKELGAHGGKMCVVPGAPPNQEAQGPSQPTLPYVQPPAVPMPEVTLKTNVFSWATAPPLRRATDVDNPSGTLRNFAVDLMHLLDGLRGGGTRIGPVSDDELNSRVWPGPFQQRVRAAAAAKPPQGRFFFLEAVQVDAVYALPWGSFQLMDATIAFRDHAEDPPAEGELWYTWHVRLPMSGTGVFAVADGYDETARGLMRVDPYWTRAQLEQEATSAVSGYLWSESYVAGGYEPFSREQPTTPFWRERLAALESLRSLFRDGALTERRFENVGVRIDRFEPLTVFGGGIVTATISGRIVEVLRGKTYVESFSAPMKFFRFGNSGMGISGWAAVDAFQDGEWVSGGDLALSTLQTAHG